MTNTRKFYAATLAVVLALLAYLAISIVHAHEEKRTMINKSTPILHVKTVEPSVKFWSERFGFKTTIQVPEGDHIGFAAIEDGNIELMYQTYEGMKAAGANPLAQAAEQGPSFIFMEVADINKVIEALKGADVVQGLHDTPYGAREVIA